MVIFLIHFHLTFWNLIAYLQYSQRKNRDGNTKIATEHKISIPIRNFLFSIKYENTDKIANKNILYF